MHQDSDSLLTLNLDNNFQPKNNDSSKRSSIFSKGNRFFLFLFLLVFLAGFAIRIYRIGEMSLWWDELITGKYAQRVLETGMPLSPSGLVVYWRGAIYTYTVSLSMLIFGHNEFSVRLPSVVFGMIVSVISFFFTYKMTKNKWIALCAMLFLSASPYNVEFSRFARFYIINAGLFLISIWLFWIGFIQKNFKWKIVSTFIFILMLHTVQLGAIYLSLFGVLFLRDIFLLINRDHWRIDENRFQLKENILFFSLSVLIFFVGNFFELFWPNSFDEVTLASDYFGEAPSRSWSWLQWPNWNLIRFFHENYIPMYVTLLGFVLGCFDFIKAIRKREEISFGCYITLVTVLSILLYEITSRGVIGARIFLFAEALIVIVTVATFYRALYLIKGKLLRTIMVYALMAMLGFNLFPQVMQSVNRKYGDSVKKDAFRNTKVASFRPDNKTTYKFIRERKKPDEIWINLMNNNYFESGAVPDIVINENPKWYRNAVVGDDKGFYERSELSKYISSTTDLEEYIHKNKSKGIWFTVNGQSVDLPYTKHIDKLFDDFLEKNQDKIMYRSPDGISKVFFFN